MLFVLGYAKNSYFSRRNLCFQRNVLIVWHRYIFEEVDVYGSKKEENLEKKDGEKEDN